MTKKKEKKNPKCCDTKLDHNSKSLFGWKEETPVEEEEVLTGRKRVEFGMEWELNSSNELHLHLEEGENDEAVAWVVAEVVDASFSSSRN